MSLPRPSSDGCQTYDGAASVARLAEYGLRPGRFVSAVTPVSPHDDDEPPTVHVERI